jgi:hypothetical protein
VIIRERLGLRQSRIRRTVQNGIESRDDWHQQIAKRIELILELTHFDLGTDDVRMTG